MYEKLEATMSMVLQDFNLADQDMSKTDIEYLHKI